MALPASRYLDQSASDNCIRQQLFPGGTSGRDRYNASGNIDYAKAEQILLQKRRKSRILVAD
jgi:hypothetical protein